MVEQRLGRKRWDRPIVERHLLAGESALGMAREDLSRKIDSGLPRKTNRNPGGRGAAAVVAGFGIEAAVEFVALVDQTVPSSHYWPTCPSHHEGAHSQDTLSSETMAGIGLAGFAGRN